jgi:DNA-binding XRE family transcriptional regulator
MDQRTLAHHFDVSPSTIGLWEKNRHLPRNIAQCAQELQQILRVPAWWLLGLSKP